MARLTLGHRSASLTRHCIGPAQGDTYTARRETGFNDKMAPEMSGKAFDPDRTKKSHVDALLLAEGGDVNDPRAR